MSPTSFSPFVAPEPQMGTPPTALVRHVPTAYEQPVYRGNPAFLAGPPEPGLGATGTTTEVDLRPSVAYYALGGAMSGAVVGLVGTAVYGAVKNDRNPSYTKGAGYGAILFAALGVVRWATTDAKIKVST